MQNLNYICTVGTLSSLHKILLVSECCVKSIKLVLPAGNSDPILGNGWIVLCLKGPAGTLPLICKQIPQKPCYLYFRQVLGDS